jgi:hypothetical protein
MQHSVSQLHLQLVAVLALPYLLLHMACAQPAPATDWTATTAPLMCPLTVSQLAVINYRPVRTACGKHSY